MMAINSPLFHLFSNTPTVRRGKFIEPGSPWENGYIDAFNGKLRDDLLNHELFTTLMEAKILVELWRKEYNQVYPYSSLGYRPPAPKAIMLTCSPKTGPKVRRFFQDAKIPWKGVLA